MERQAKSERATKGDAVTPGRDSRMSKEALEFSQLVTSAGEAAIGVMGATEATRAVMCAALSLAGDKHGMGMSPDDIVDWLHRLAAEVKARSARPS